MQVCRKQNLPWLQAELQTSGLCIDPTVFQLRYRMQQMRRYTR